MNILILGSGGREHAFAWKIAQSPLCDRLYIAPGNAGTAQCGQNVEIAVSDFPGIARFCLEHAVDLVLPGGEEPLVLGITDYFRDRKELTHIKVAGPVKAGAMLEGSKDFAKAFMARHGIPTAAYRSFDAAGLEEAYGFLRTLKPPYVLKADGLAAGKGVVIPETLDEARKELHDMLAGARFGQASARVVIEEFLPGIEVSVFVLTDGKDYLILPEAKDYKRIGEGDTGPNTGGMGAISPVPFFNEEFCKKVEERIIKPTVKGLASEGIDYRGFIFLGLMNVQGDPYVIEYNVRMGDPETEAVLMRVESDLLQLLNAVCERKLGAEKITISDKTAATVVVVSQGYPGEYEKGRVINLPGTPAETVIFHSGTREKEGALLSNGGRVLAVSSLAEGLPEALSHSLQVASDIRFAGRYFRRDIGQDLLILKER